MHPEKAEKSYLKWFEQLYNDLGTRYLDYDFTKGTKQEVDFLENIFGHDKTLFILDVGCGPGRHTVELANRGYQVVGIDLSQRLLRIAQANTIGESANPSLVRCDARALPFLERFDFAISLCEGAFGILDSDRDNEAILQQVYLALKPNGRFLLNILNASFAFRHPEYDSRVDVKFCRGYWTEIYTSEQGEPHQIDCSNRYYTYPEIKLLLEKYGFQVLDGWGCIAGNFSKKEIELDDFELLIFAQKV